MSTAMIIAVVVVFALIIGAAIYTEMHHEGAYTLKPDRRAPEPPKKPNEMVMTRGQLEYLRDFTPIYPKWLTYGDYTFSREEIVMIKKCTDDTCDIYLRDGKHIVTVLKHDDVTRVLGIRAYDIKELVNVKPVRISGEDIMKTMEKYKKRDDQ